MDIISFAQAEKANKKVQELEIKLGHLTSNKNGLLPVQDSFNSVEERLAHLEEIQSPEIIFTEASHLAEQKMKLLNEETLRVESLFKSKSYGMNKMIFIGLRDLSSIDLDQTKDILFEEEYSRAIFNSESSILYLNPINEEMPISYVYVAVATKTEEEISQFLVDLTYENLLEAEDENILQPIELDKEAIITSSLIKIEDSTPTRFIPLVPEISSEEIGGPIQYKVQYSVKIGEIPVITEKIKVSEDEEIEDKFEPVFGEWADMIDLYEKSFRFRIIIQPSELVIPEEPEADSKEKIYRSYIVKSIGDISYKNFSINSALADIRLGDKSLSLEEGTRLEGENMNEKVLSVRLPKGSELNAMSISWI